MAAITASERRFRFLMWRWTRRLTRKGNITDEQAQNILHNLRENPTTEDEGCFLEELQTAVALALPTGVDVTLAIYGENYQVQGMLSDIFGWLLDHWETILEIVLFLITLF
jgi:hypothetical protein